MTLYFKDRQDAAYQLAIKLKDFREQENVVLLGLARGGVVLASILAEVLKLPMDIICPKKIAHPINPEYGVGAVTEYGDAVIDEEAALTIGLNHAHLGAIKDQKLKEAIDKSSRLRDGTKPLVLKGKTVILVDDGLATGFTLLASIATVKRLQAKQVICAIPVAAKTSAEKVKAQCDRWVCLLEDPLFSAVGQFYEDFSEVTDEMVMEYLKKNYS